MEVRVKVWMSTDEMGIYELPIRFAEVDVDAKRYILQSPAECEFHPGRFLGWQLIEGAADEKRLRVLEQAAEAAWQLELLENRELRKYAHSTLSRSGKTV